MKDSTVFVPEIWIPIYFPIYSRKTTNYPTFNIWDGSPCLLVLVHEIVNATVVDWRAQKPRATLLGENVAWETATNS